MTTTLGYDDGSIAGPAKTVVDPITSRVATAQANQSTSTASAPWGNAMPVSMGKRSVVGKIIWCSDLREVPQSEEVTSDTSTKARYEVDFAVSFGRPTSDPADRFATSLVRLWAQQVLCFDINDGSVGDGFNGMRVTFHPGLVDAIPDSLVQADKGDLAPAWRNQIYVTVKSFPLWKIGLTDGLPDVVAELFDATLGGSTITSYTMSTVALQGTSPLIYDANRNVAYAFIDGGAGVEKLGTYDIATLTELNRLTIAGHGTTYTQLQPHWLAVHDKDNGYLLTVDQTGNSTPLHLVNLGTGSILSSIGTNTASTGPDTATEITFKISGDAIKTQMLGGTFYGFVLGGIFDQVAVLTYPKEGTSLHFAEGLNLGGTIGIGALDDITDITAYPIIGRTDLQPTPQKQDAFVFVSRGTHVTMLRLSTVFDGPPAPPVVPGGPPQGTVNMLNGEQVDVVNIPGAKVQATWIDPSDWNLVVFWIPVDGSSVQMVTKYKVTTSQTSESGWWPYVGDIVYQIELPAYYFAKELRYNVREQISNGVFGYGGVNKFYEIDLASGATLAVTNVARSFGSDGYIYNSRGTVEFINTGSQLVEHIRLRSAATDKMPLAKVITTFMLDAGYTEDQFTVDAGIDDMVYGALLDASTDLWETMKNLGAAFDFVYFISGNVIKFVRPATVDDTPAYTIDIDKLHTSGSNPYEALSTTLAAPDELAGNVAVRYIDVDQHYVANTQTFRRSSFPTPLASEKNDTTVSIPIVMKADEALRRSAVATFAAFAESQVQSLKLPVAYLRLEPADSINVSAGDGFTFNILIGETVLDTDWTYSITGSNRAVRNSRVGPSGDFAEPGSATFVSAPDVPPSLGPAGTTSEAVVFDVPLIKPTDDLTLTFASIYAGASALKKSGWTGALVSTQVDGQPWVNLLRAFRSVPVGRASAALPATAAPFQTDYDTVLTVDVANADSSDTSLFATVSTANLLTGANAMLVGDVGRWELVYFGNVARDGNLLLLSTLVRGMRGTEKNCNNHTAGDHIVFVTLGGTRQGFAQAGAAYTEVGETFRARARSDGFVGPIATTEVPVEANSLKPWAPCRLKMTIDGGNNLTITWIRRDRLGTEFVTTAQPMSEASQVYDLEILSGSDILREVNGLTSPTHVYTASEQSADGFVPPLSSLKVRVYQVSTNVGRGFAGEATMNIGDA